jgi:hypothetical protein
MDNHFVICTCQTPEHIIRFMYDKADNELYTEVYLNNYNSFFKRCWIALKYILGYKSKYGHWDSTIINKQERTNLFYFLRNTI